jgi:hypothetical protein
MSAVAELRPPAAGRLLAIRRETRALCGDGLEQGALCNAAVLAEACRTEEGQPAFDSPEAVLSSLTFPEMEALLTRLGARAPAPVNPGFDERKFAALRERGGA